MTALAPAAVATTSSTPPLLEVHNLAVHFPVRRGLLQRNVGWIKAVDGVSLQIHKGQTLGLVGESGCGKSTLGRAILRLIPVTHGRILFDDQDVLAARGPQLKALRRRMQIVFQDPYGSLNPRLTVGKMLAEPILVHNLAPPSQVHDRVAQLLPLVGLTPDAAHRYPHEFSGGQRQRIGIARALALQPDFIICDEPVSALDVSIQGQILNLLADLRDQLGLSYLFIAHNLAVVQYFCEHIAVMYLGRIVESGPRQAIIDQPRHPYTQTLLTAVPLPQPRRRRQRLILAGEPPSPLHPPTGCAFHPRCPLTRQLAQQAAPQETLSISLNGQILPIMQRCVQEQPRLTPVHDPTPPTPHQVACFYHDLANHTEK